MLFAFKFFNLLRETNLFFYFGLTTCLKLAVSSSMFENDSMSASALFPVYDLSSQAAEAGGGVSPLKFSVRGTSP